MVRPHLEYANTVWHPHLKKSKILIENVQRRATKRLMCCQGLEYEDRLRYLQLPCLGYRRIRGDVIEVYKMVHEKYDKEIDPPITLAKPTNIKTRGNMKKLHKKPFDKRARNFFFGTRVVNFWNGLPNNVVMASSINSFKNQLDKFWKKYNIMYNPDNCMEFETRMITGTGVRPLQQEN